MHVIPRYGTALRSEFPNSVDTNRVCGTLTGYILVNLQAFQYFFPPFFFFFPTINHSDEFIRNYGDVVITTVITYLNLI